MTRVYEVRYLETRRFFSSRERAEVFIETLARAMGIGTKPEFELREERVDSP